MRMRMRKQVRGWAADAVGRLLTLGVRTAFAFAAAACLQIRPPVHMQLSAQHKHTRTRARTRAPAEKLLQAQPAHQRTNENEREKKPTAARANAAVIAVESGQPVVRMRMVKRINYTLIPGQHRVRPTDAGLIHFYIGSRSCRVTSLLLDDSDNCCCWWCV